MQLWESVLIALRALTVNKLRTVLTMLGIIIGVAAVIALISIGNGVSQSMTERLSSMGTNLLTISSAQGMGGPGGGPGGPPGSEDDESQADLKEKAAEPLTMKDVDALSDSTQVRYVVAVAPTYSVNGASVVRDQAEADSVSITGVTVEYQSVRDLTLAQGRFITQDEVDQRARVAVIGSEVAEKLFASNESPLDENIRINGLTFEVIGVLPESGEGGFGNPDNTALVPLSTAQTRLDNAGAFRGSLKVSTIYIEVDSQNNMDAAEEQVTAVLRERHRLGDEYKNDFRQ